MDAFSIVHFPFLSFPFLSFPFLLKMSESKKKAYARTKKWRKDNPKKVMEQKKRNRKRYRALGLCWICGRRTFGFEKCKKCRKKRAEYQKKYYHAKIKNK